MMTLYLGLLSVACVLMWLLIVGCKRYMDTVHGDVHEAHERLQGVIGYLQDAEDAGKDPNFYMHNARIDLQSVQEIHSSILYRGNYSGYVNFSDVGGV